MSKYNDFFNVGDKVTWTSQAGGRTKTKVGIVEYVICAHDEFPRDITDFREILRKNSFVVPFTRNHDSYIVNVDGVRYHPRVSGLKPVYECDCSVGG